MSSDVTCPTCGTVSHLDELSRDAMAFCRVCDYPLFWIRGSGGGAGEGGMSGEPGLRRLPGTAGLVTIATLKCPVCTEPNPIAGDFCIRCGSDLHPRPFAPAAPAPPLPPPEPEPEPPPPKPPLIPAAWVPALVMSVLLVLFCLVAAVVLILR